jgi:hypothetical protein
MMMVMKSMSRRRRAIVLLHSSMPHALVHLLCHRLLLQARASSPNSRSQKQRAGRATPHVSERYARLMQLCMVPPFLLPLVIARFLLRMAEHALFREFSECNDPQAPLQQVRGAALGHCVVSQLFALFCLTDGISACCVWLSTSRIVSHR